MSDQPDDFDFDEPTLEDADPVVRDYVIGAVGLSIVVWDVAFNYGVYGAVFFNRYFAVWVVCTAVLLASMFLPAEQRPVGFIGAVALFVPTLWLILAWLLPAGTRSLPAMLRVMTTLAEIITLLSFPYIGYVLLDVSHPGQLSLPRRLLYGLVGVTVVIAIVGFVIGRNHPQLLTCEQFRVSGNDVPADCRTE